MLPQSCALAATPERAEQVVLWQLLQEDAAMFAVEDTWLSCIQIVVVDVTMFYSGFTSPQKMVNRLTLDLIG